MSHDTLNGAFATGGVIQGREGPVFEPGPSPFTLPAQMAAQVAPHALGTPARPPIASPIPVPDPTVHEMPSGHTVTIASPRVLNRGQRLKLVHMADNENTTALDQINVMFTWQITGWSYPFPVPAADATSLDLIPAEDDDALIDLVVKPVKELLFPPAPSPDDHADETSPTAPSGA